MADEGLHQQWIATASTALVVGEEEAGVPQIAVVVQEGFLGAQSTEVMFFFFWPRPYSDGSIDRKAS